jgi:hypothetical protein
MDIVIKLHSLIVLVIPRFAFEGQGRQVTTSGSTRGDS